MVNIGLDKKDVEKTSKQNDQFPSNGLFSYATTLFFGIGLTIGAYLSVDQYRQFEQKERFEKPAIHATNAIKESLHSYIDILKTLEVFFVAQPNVDAKEFSIFSKQKMNNTVGVQALEWVPRVSYAQKDEYTQKIRSSGFDDFEIKEISADGKLIAVSSRDEYYPVYFVEPYQENKRAHGFDLASNPIRMQALEAARDTGQEVASAKISLIQEAGKKSGILLFLPVFIQTLPNATIQERRASLIGFTLGVFSIDDIVEQTLSSIALPKGLDIFLIDESNEADPYLYYKPQNKTGFQGEQLTVDELMGGVHYSEQFSFGSRSWRMVVYPGPSIISDVNRIAPFAAALFCLLLTGLLLLSIRSQSQRRYSIESEVVERTQELHASRLEAATAQQQLIDAIEALPDAFALYDDQDRLVIFNENYRKLYDKSREAIVVGNRFKDILKTGIANGQYQEIKDGVDADIWLKDRLIQHKTSNYSKEQQLANGEWLRVVERQTAGGNTVGFRVNITELKENETRLERIVAGQIESNKVLETQKQQLSILAEDLKKARDEAEESSRIKSDFLSTMSHEIRTPMNGVLGMANLLIQTKLDKEQRHFAEIIYSSGDALLSIIYDILDFSKLESGQQEISPINFQLQLTTNWVKSILNTKTHENNNVLLIDIDKNVPHWLKGDEHKIRQVLLNLTGNAVKFTHDGEIKIKAKYRESKKNNASLHIEVVDTGIGIDQAVIPKLFDRFTQADSSTTREYGGTGLGLSICKKLITLLGGEIDVESKKGEGTKFWFDIPIETGVSTSVDRLPNDELNANHFIRPLNILVAEDHATNQVLITAMLEKAGHKVIVASNGREAIDEISNKLFDVVLMDIQMPVMDGIDATKAIRQLDGAVASIPIIAVTANAMREHIQIYHEIGMNDFVAKPVDATKLAVAIKTVCKSLCETYDHLDIIAQINDPELDQKTESIIDIDVIDRMVQSTSQEIMESLIASFPHECENQLEEIKNAFKSGNFKQFNAAAHTLKGVASSFGATQITRIAKEAETGDQATAETVIENLSKAIYDVRVWLTDKGYTID